jgi:hypothetical protein
MNDSPLPDEAAPYGAKAGDMLVYTDSAGLTHGFYITNRDGDHGLTLATLDGQTYVAFGRLVEQHEDLRVKPAPGRVGEGEVER